MLAANYYSILIYIMFKYITTIITTNYNTALYIFILEMGKYLYNYHF